MTVKAAHIRLCHSRMPFVRVYPRETQEMVFDATTGPSPCSRAHASAADQSKNSSASSRGSDSGLREGLRLWIRENNL